MLTPTAFPCPHCGQEIDLRQTLDARLLDELRSGLTDEAARQQAERERLLAEEFRIKLLEKDRLIRDLHKRFEDGQRRAAQGSPQQQGAAAEADLLHLLEREFRHDAFTPLNTQGDLLQEVFTQRGNACGRILWEVKQAATWRNDWLAKARQDMLTRDAALAVIVTRMLPAGLAEFGEVEGVWVTTRAHATGLATVFRAMLIQVARTRHMASLHNGHGRALADYMAGPAFRTKMEAALRLLARRQAALERERARHQREWAGAAQETEQILQLLLEIGAEVEEQVAERKAGLLPK